MKAAKHGRRLVRLVGCMASLSGGAHAGTWLAATQASAVDTAKPPAPASTPAQTASPVPASSPAQTASPAPAATPAPASAPASIKVRGGLVVSNRLNTTDHALRLTAPLSSVDRKLGDVDILVEPDDSLRVSKASLMAALAPILSEDRQKALSDAATTDGYLSLADMSALQMPMVWDPNSLRLSITVAGGARSVQQLNIADEDQIGASIPMAKTSAYLNMRTAVSSYASSGQNSDVNLDLESGLRVHGLLFQNEAAYRPLVLGGQQEFVREGTRVIWDDRKRLMRFTFGDQQPLNRGFQAFSDMAGIGVYRTYEDLDPLRNARPTGTSAFTLQRPSMVETLVNGVPTAQFQLNPGRYNLNNIPYTQGANNVTIRVTDDLGMQQDINFSLFFDRQLLAKGLSEFAFYAGVPSDISTGRIEYMHNRYIVSGYYRRGLTENLTLGGNFQSDNRSGMAGGEALWASPIGSFGGDVAYSWASGGQSGYAINTSYESTLTRDNIHSTSFGLSLTMQSANFMPVEIYQQPPVYKYQVSANLSHGFSINTTAFAQLDYSKGRGLEPDLASAGLGVTQRITDRIYLSAEARYEKTAFHNGYGVRVALNYRFGRHTTATAISDTVNDLTQLSLNSSHGHGVGAWTANADVIRQTDGDVVNANLNYDANRAEIILNQSTPFDTTQGSSLSGQTTLSVGTALVMADGHWGIGRPIYDSFVMAMPHRTLKSRINLDMTPEGVVARSGMFGPAVDPEIGSYMPRNVTYTAPDAPAGYDVGSGSVRVLPAYRSAYVIVVGSDYNVMAYGRMYFANGKPIPLLAGQATELAHPERAPIQIFTNAQGRFSLTGARPGRWRVDMPANPAVSFIIDIPEGNNLVNLGDLKASQP